MVHFAPSATPVRADASADPEVPPTTGTPDPDAVEELGDQIATLAAHIHAATERLLALLAEFDRLRGWERSGHRDCTDWLSARTGIDRGAAQEKVRAARALTGLPLTREAMARGELSFSKVRALTRVAEPHNERELVELARGVTTAQLERMVRAWKKGSRQDEVERERERHESRTLSVFPDDDGMYVVRGWLTPEVGALLMRALEVAGDALFGERRAPGLGPDDPEVARRDAAHRRADAIGLLAERALAAGFGEEDSAPASGARAERHQVVLHVDSGDPVRRGQARPLPSWRTGRDFQLKARGGWRATRAWSELRTGPTAPSST